MNSEVSQIRVVRMLQNQTKVLLLPFIRGEGRDEGLLLGVRVHGQGSQAEERFRGNGYL
jgi:hypothetical protein